MTSRVCNDISVAHRHQVLSITMIGELLSQVLSEWIFCVITGKKYVFFLMQVPSSTEKYQYIGSRSLGLATATFPCCWLYWGHIAVVISDNPHLYIALIRSTQHYSMPRYLPFLKFFTYMGSTVLCRVHTGLLCVLQQVDRCIFQLQYGLIHRVASTLGLCRQTRGYQSLLPGRYPRLKIVLSQTPQQRVTLLSSEACLQPQPFRPLLLLLVLCLISFADVVQHIWVFFIKITYRLIIMQIYPSRIACVG